MTGQYNVRNYLRFGKLDRSQTTFAHQLKAAGYATAIAGKLVEKIIRQLEELGLRDNTLVIFTGDNGNKRFVVVPLLVVTAACGFPD